MVLYRYYIEYSNNEAETKVCFHEVPILEETEKCYWIKKEGKKKRISKSTLSSLKGYCSDSKEIALKQLYWRCKKAIFIINNSTSEKINNNLDNYK